MPPWMTFGKGMADMKKLIALILALTLTAASACAEIRPPTGPAQLGYEAVVLCQSLTVRSGPGTSARAVRTLHAGDVLAVMNPQDGWYECFLSETGGSAGWVSGDYIIIDPAWYATEKATPVYAWNDRSAYRVGLLDAGTRYPILRMEEGWVLIGLRGAAGWIYDPVNAVGEIGFDPGRLGGVARAELMSGSGSTHTLDDPAGLNWIRENFSISQPVTPSKCPFNAVINLVLEDGSQVSLTLATDGCPIFRTAGGGYYSYGPNISGQSGETARAFWALFGLTMEELN